MIKNDCCVLNDSCNINIVLILKDCKGFFIEFEIFFFGVECI